MYVFKPLLKQTIWGGETITAFKDLETDTHSIGESWEISAVKDFLSVVADGKDEGKTIIQLLDEQKEKLVGKDVYAHYSNTFPLLIKFIDARQDLSIQVHPDDKTAMMRHGSLGKTEMWYIIKADEDSFISAGFKQPVKKEDYNRIIQDHSITEVLNKETVRVGDVYFLPPGTVHSLGAGVFVAEIQETSDITYRIYDYCRKDAQGKERELHTEQAKEVIDFSSRNNHKISYKENRDKRVELVNCPFFTTNIIKATKSYHADYSKLDSFVVIMCIDGEATITENGIDGKEQRIIKQGNTVLIPATTQSIDLEPINICKILEVYIRM